MNKEEIKNMQEEGARRDPGVAYDIANQEKVTPQMVKDRVKEQNNNPRNNDM